MNSDICKDVMHSEKLTCVIADEKEIIFKSDKKGIVPMLEFLDLYREKGLQPVYQADRIIGKAAIIIAAHCGISEIYADVVSQSAMNIACEKGITIYCDQLVEMILNPSKTKEGPFEAALHDVDPEDFEKVLETVRKTLAEIKAMKK
ncbi:MAG: DUF1893 domain-containing protein [Erysipelotrichaceae bacterium]|nr:DUF1893 domain-containing protein [Erysipelotrichaceae bacterium]